MKIARDILELKIKVQGLKPLFPKTYSVLFRIIHLKKM